MTDSLGWRQKFAVLIPSTNTSVQPEFDAMRPVGVTNHISRIRIPNIPLHTNEDFNRLIEPGVKNDVISAPFANANRGPTEKIIIGDTEGSVERIELRATQIRTYDGRRVLVPNAETFTSRVTNNTAAPVRRGQVICYLGYEVDLPQVMSVLKEAARGAEGVIAEPPPTVAIREMGQSELAFQVQFWCDSRRSDFMLTASRVRANLIEALRASGIALPGPGVHQVVLREGGSALDEALPRRRSSDED